MSIGIDYGMGTTNINHKTGIRCMDARMACQDSQF